MKTKQRKSQAAAPPENEPAAIYVRNVDALRKVRAVPRLRALAKRAGVSEASITRALIMLGIERAERDPAALSQAFNES